MPLEEPTIGAKRRRKTIAVNDLEEAEVRRISLVSRGANRIPYRIMKAENEDMLDLGSIFRRKAEGAAEVEASKALTIAAVVLNKTADTKGLIALMGEQGFDMAGATIDEEILDHGVLVKFEDYDPDTSFVMQFTNDVAAIMVDSEKTFSPFGGSSRFTENVQAMGFVPGLRMAQDALMETTFNILGEADDKNAAKSDIDSALKDFSAHVSSLASSLPMDAFKLEDLRVVKQEEEESEKEESKKEIEKTESTVIESTATESTAVKPAEKAGDVETPDGEDAAAEVEEKDNDTLNKMFSNMLGQMDDKLKSVKDALLANLDERIAIVSKDNEDLMERLKTAEEKAKETDESMRGTVLAQSTFVDESLGVRNRDGLAKTVKEDESLDRSGLFDSAFSFPGIDDRG